MVQYLSPFQFFSCFGIAGDNTITSTHLILLPSLLPLFIHSPIPSISISFIIYQVGFFSADTIRVCGSANTLSCYPLPSSFTSRKQLSIQTGSESRHWPLNDTLVFLSLTLSFSPLFLFVHQKHTLTQRGESVTEDFVYFESWRLSLCLCLYTLQKHTHTQPQVRLS